MKPAGRWPAARPFAAAVAIALAGGWALSAPGCRAKPESPLAAMEGAVFARTFELDGRQYRELDAGLARVLALLEEHRAMFDEGPKRLLTPDEEALVVDAWAAYLDGAFAVDQIRRFYEDYDRLEPDGHHADRHLRSFLLSFAAELSVYEKTGRLIALLEKNPNVEKFLDEARPERHIAAGSLTFVKEELAGLTDLDRVRAGRRYLAELEKEHEAKKRAEAGGYGWLLPEVQRHLDAVAARKGDATLKSMAADLAPIKRGLKKLVFPLVKGVAELMGDTRVKRGGKYLIAAAQLEELRAKSAPGDVWLVRKNWYLSNMGLPGFWPHAVLYVGSNADLAAAFDADPETAAWVRKTSGKELTFSAWLGEAHPAAWKARADSHGEHALLVVEAISEGVSHNTLEHASGDYLASLRPKLPKWVKAAAIARAFAYLGRPYDFDFDFATDTSLVCTELVWRSYRPTGELPGLSLPTVKVAGRETLPANEIAALYVRERGKPGAQFDFVTYYEGREEHLDAVVRGEEAFLRTPERSKWSFDQP